MNTCNTKKIASRGFTLIESLVAIFIFSLAIVGLMTVVSRGIAGTNAAANQVTAHFLAQEGLEVARSMRDDGMIQRSTKFMPDIVKAECDTKTCGVTYKNDRPILEPCNSRMCQVRIDQGRYNDFVGDQTAFVRGITVGIRGDSAVVTSEVTWLQGSTDRVVRLETILHHWFKSQ